MSLLQTVVLAAGGFAAAGLLGTRKPGTGRWLRQLLALLAAGFAMAGSFSSPAPTGTVAVDAVLRAGLCGATVLFAARAESWALVAAASVTMLGGIGSAAAAPSALAFGLSSGALFGHLDRDAVKAMAGGLVAVGALRIERPTAVGATAALAALALALVVASGWRGLGRPARRRLASTACLATGLAALGGGLGVLAAAQARPAVQEGISNAAAGIEAARAGDVKAATRLLNEGASAFSSARGRLDSWWARPAWVLPVVTQHGRALRAMTASGSELSRLGAGTLAAADTSGLRLAEGAVQLDRIMALRGPASQAFSALAHADARLLRARSPWLVPLVSNRLDHLADRVGRARRDARVAMVATDVAPSLLGAEGPRRYFLAVQTPAELRASGGFIGNFGEISADAGRVRLERVGRTDDLNTGGDPESRRLVASPDYTARYARFEVERHWQNVTMSPDFPTVARAIANLYPQSGGRPVDGVVAIDPIGLAALLDVIGPVQVPSWPVPITGDNAARVLLFEQYVALEGTQRVDFLATVTQAVWGRLTSGSFDAVKLVRAMGPMVAEKHLQLASTHPREERGFIDLGAGGQMAPARHDFFGLVTQNASGNKIDWFLRRSIAYRAEVDPKSGELRATARIALRNQAPADGLPSYIIGNLVEPPLPSGTNKTYVSVYTPLLLEGARIDGRPLLLETEVERDRHVYSTYLTIPPGGSAILELDLQGRMDTSDGYRLDLYRQAFLAPDPVEVVTIVGDRRRTTRLQLTGDSTILGGVV